MSVENFNYNKEIDQNKEYIEIEKQLVAIDPEKFEQYKSLELDVIEQIYLSHPDEDFSLRLRETVTTEGSEYTATLKDSGQVEADGINRMEVETPISADLYNYYKSHGTYPALRKLRANPVEGVAIDWCEGSNTPIVEIENLATNPAGQEFYEQHYANLVDKTGSAEVSCEVMAHNLSPDMMPAPADEIDESKVVAEIMRLKAAGKKPIITSIAGRSGSGKSTITNRVIDMLGSDVSAVRVSTDDYNRGKSWIESNYGEGWSNWDDPIVYDTALLSDDLDRLTAGESIDARRFDFGLEETVVEGAIEPSDVVIVEGIYSGSPDLETHRDMQIIIPTPLATCVGRRLVRDVKERTNESFGTAADILRYQLETAEPMYRQQTA